VKVYEVAVVGSGAGGGPAAAALADAWGDGVVLIEAGRHFKREDFNQLERDMLPALYAQSGLQGTEDGAIGMLQGRAVGGSTVVNDAICFRPPPEIEERWAALDAPVSVAELQPFVEEVERTLSVTQIPRHMINRANYLVGLGAARMGWAGDRLHHNSPGCVQCGFRHIGCAYDAKRSMNLTFVPLAVMRGAELRAQTEVQSLERKDGVWTLHTQGEPILAKRVVLAAGVVMTPTLLLRSGIEAGEGLQSHLCSVAWGDFEDRVDGFAGIPMAYGVLEHSDVYGHTGPGYLIEGVSVQPLSFSVQPQFHGLEHEDVLARYPYLAGALGVVRSKGRGRIELGPGGRPAIHHPLVEEDATRIADFYAKATEMFLAAGAKRALLAHRETRWVDAPPTDVCVEKHLAYLYAPHHFGGANRGTVCDAEGRVKGQEDLWVLDASAIPEALGVNPQVTIAALALQGAGRLLG
jgi:choline dehydrogenase-like flavoprotein